MIEDHATSYGACLEQNESVQRPDDTTRAGRNDGSLPADRLLRTSDAFQRLVTQLRRVSDYSHYLGVFAEIRGFKRNTVLLIVIGYPVRGM